MSYEKTIIISLIFMAGLWPRFGAWAILCLPIGLFIRAFSETNEDNKAAERRRQAKKEKENENDS